MLIELGYSLTPPMLDNYIQSTPTMTERLSVVGSNEKVSGRPSMVSEERKNEMQQFLDKWQFSWDQHSSKMDQSTASG